MVIALDFPKITHLKTQTGIESPSYSTKSKCYKRAVKSDKSPNPISYSHKITNGSAPKNHPRGKKKQKQKQKREKKKWIHK